MLYFKMMEWFAQNICTMLVYDPTMNTLQCAKHDFILKVYKVQKMYYCLYGTETVVQK